MQAIQTRMRAARVITRALRCSALALLLLTVVATRSEGAERFIPELVNSSTIPPNGDVNPYGVAFVPEHFPSGGTIAAGDVLVSNFNSTASVPGTGIQGTGTTIAQLAPSGTLASPGNAVTFFSSSLPGLSTALGVLKGGFVIVGNVPTPDGSFGGITQGALQIIDRHGTLLHIWTDATFLDTPWDLTIDDDGSTAHIFVSNVRSGTVSRLDVSVGPADVKLLNKTTVAMGYTVMPNMGAVILGPTGLAYDEKTDTLYVASTADNAIYAVKDASDRKTAVKFGNLVFADSHLRGPLALRLAPNGNLLTANGDAVNMDPLHPSEVVEFTTGGRFVGEYNVDASQGGAFGLDAVSDSDSSFNFAVIDDVTNSLSVYRLPGH